MWLDDERTPEEAKANPLTQINIKTNEEGELIGMQLVYAQSGASPFFTTSSIRLLNDTQAEPADL